MTDGELDRRTVLSSIGSSLGVAFSGCIGSRGAQTSAQIKAEVQSTEMLIRYNDAAELDSINVISPSGSLFAQKAVPEGSTKVTFPIEQDYNPGTYQIIGVKSDEKVSSTSITIRPALEIGSVTVGANDLEDMPPDLHFRENQAAVQIRNRGSGPEWVDKLLFAGGVPNPTTDLRETEKSGIYDESDGMGQAEQVTVEAGEVAKIYSTTMPFQVDDPQEFCEPHSTRSFRVILGVVVGTEQTRKEFEAEYSSREDSSQCKIKVHA